MEALEEQKEMKQRADEAKSRLIMAIRVLRGDADYKHAEKEKEQVEEEDEEQEKEKEWQPSWSDGGN